MNKYANVPIDCITAELAGVRDDMAELKARADALKAELTRRSPGDLTEFYPEMTTIEIIAAEHARFIEFMRTFDLGDIKEDERPHVELCSWDNSFDQPADAMFICAKATAEMYVDQPTCRPW